MTSRSNASEPAPAGAATEEAKPGRTRRARRVLTAREAALRQVSRRMLSERELAQRLQRRGYDEAAVAEAIAMVKDYGYLDDGELASAVQREALRTGRGPGWVRTTLRRRGVAEALARNAETASRDGATARARDVLLRRFGEPSELDERDRQRALRFLVGRGFPPEAALDALGAD